MKNLQSLPKAILYLLITFTFFTGTANQHKDEFVNFYLSSNNILLPGAEATANVGFYYTPESDIAMDYTLLKIKDPAVFIKENYEILIGGSFDVLTPEGSALLEYMEPMKKWSQEYKKRTYNYTADIGKIEEAGIYVLQAVYKDNVAYCPIICSEDALVNIYNNYEVLSYVTDIKTGEFREDAEITFFRDGEIAETRTAPEGIVLFDKENEGDSRNYYTMATFEGRTVFSLDHIWSWFSSSEQTKGYIYTNQPVYRPGAAVNFKGILRKKAGNDWIPIADSEFDVVIRSSKNKEIYKKKIKTNDHGSLFDKVVLDEEADLGLYYISISSGDFSFSGTFNVEEYKKPEYRVEVKLEKTQYPQKGTVQGTVKADYYFGSPVTNGTVSVNIYKRRFWIPWWYWSEWAWYYQKYFSQYYTDNSEQYVDFIEGELNEDGEFEFEYDLNETDDNDFKYEFRAEVVDNSMRTIYGSSDAFVTRGAFSLSASTSSYYVQAGSRLSLNVNSFTFDMSPVETEFKIIVSRYDYHKGRNYDKDTIAVLKGSTNTEGEGSVFYTPDEPGYYYIEVTAEDENGNKISATDYFYAGSSDWSSGYFNTSSLTIITDKKVYKKGETVTGMILLPFENSEFIFTLERERFIEYKRVKAEGGSYPFSFKIENDHVPGFKIYAAVVNDKGLHSAQQVIGVLPVDKYLNVDIKPAKEIYAPGEKAEYEILVTDNNGAPVKNAELSFGTIDESVYAIMPDKTPAIKDFFYSYGYSYRNVNTSFQYWGYSVMSRKITKLDKDFFALENKINENATGKLKGSIEVFDYDGNNITSDDLYRIDVLVTNGRKTYTAPADEKRNYSFDALPEAEYNVFIIIDGSAFIYKTDIEISEGKTATLDLKITSEQIDNATGLYKKELYAMDDAETTRSDSREKSLSPPPPKGESKDGDYAEAEVRKNFVDAAVWEPALVTDADGKATVEFTMPDNLTEWRSTVRCATIDTKVGENTNAVITRKDLIVRLETPRFFREGDRMFVTTNIHNYLSEEKDVKIKFTAENVELINAHYDGDTESGNEFRITIPENGEKKINWEIEINSSSGNAVLYAEALTDEESDAVELKVPVLPKGISQVTGLNSILETSGEIETINFEIPENVNLETAKVSFNFAPTIGKTVLKSLDDLVKYPYGCVEQTMSRFLPAIITAQTFKNLDVPLKSETIEKLPKVIDKGLSRLYDMQHYDGGWGWWKNDATRPFMTAYVVYGFALAQEAGYDIDVSVFTSGVNSLRQQLLNSKEIEPVTKAYMVFVLTNALKGNMDAVEGYEGILDELMGMKLNDYGMALLGLTYNLRGMKTEAQVIAKQLIDKADVNERFAKWGDAEFDYYWQDDRVQHTAFVIKFLVNTGIDDKALIDKGVSWLISKQRGYSWNSTLQTSMVIFALTDYLHSTNELNPEYVAEVYVNGKMLESRKYSNDNIFREYKDHIILPVDGILEPGENTIEIKKKGTGKLYFSGMSTYFSPEIDKPYSENFSIEKKYFKLVKTREAGSIVYKKEPLEHIKTGDDIFVKVIVKPAGQDLQYMMLEDMLPSGFEVVKEDNYYNIPGEENYSGYDDHYYGYWRWFYAQKEIRDEKVSFFVTYPNREMQFEYIMKAQLPGSYAVMPAEAQLMYYPEVFGTSNPVYIEVEER